MPAIFQCIGSDVQQIAALCRRSFGGDWVVSLVASTFPDATATILCDGEQVARQPAALIIERMQALMASGSVGQALTTTAELELLGLPVRRVRRFRVPLSCVMAVFPAFS